MPKNNETKRKSIHLGLLIAHFGELMIGSTFIHSGSCLYPKKKKFRIYLLGIYMNAIAFANFSDDLGRVHKFTAESGQSWLILGPTHISSNLLLFRWLPRAAREGRPVKPDLNKSHNYIVLTAGYGILGFAFPLTWFITEMIQFHIELCSLVRGEGFSIVLKTTGILALRITSLEAWWISIAICETPLSLNFNHSG